MKLISSFIKHFFVPCFILLLTMVVAGCSEDNQEELQQGDGYVQFKLYKSASYDDVQSRATSDKLDNLSQAKKMQVVLLHNNVTITQTVALSSYNDQDAEYGLRSEKLELTAGEYTLVGYYLYDKVEQPILAGEPSKPTTFVVNDGGLTVQNVLIDAVMTGKVNFTLIKNLPSTREYTDQEPFENIYQFEVEVKNLETKEIKTFRDIKVKYKEGFDDENIQIATAITDTTLFLKAGTYQYVKYYLYKKSDANNAIGFSNEFPEGLTFTVEDNKLTKAELPVKIGLADYLKDYVALKEIWEKLGGEKWSYVGELFPRGANWDFNKQMDMWGQQPGVTLNEKGRVTALNLGGFNPQGAVPESLGQLTALRVLTIGSHNDVIGGGPVEQYGGNPTPEQMQIIRNDYYNKFLARDPRAGFSKTLQFGFKLKGEPIVERKNGGISQKDVQFGEYTNGVTSLPESIGNLTNLEQLYIANCKIKSLPASMAKLGKCSDVEVYNCPLMLEYPEVLNQMEGVIMLILAVNKQWSSEVLYKGLEGLAAGAAKEKLQVLYLGNNNLTALPDLGALKSLNKLDCVNNKIRTMHAFPSTVNISQLTMGNNLIERVPKNADGRFCGYVDIETFSFSNNKITEFPDIFDAKSMYVMGGVDFSHNQITSIENENSENYKGVNASTVDLSYNKFTEFPKALFKAGSPIASLNLSGNSISKIEKKALIGKCSYMMSSLDLSFNQLEELPSDFDATTFPYLYGLELSYNRFKEFPYNPLNISYLTIFSIRHQRDAGGNRCLREWPKNIYKHTGLRALYLSSNDIRKVEDDQISYLIYNLDISDNPNIVIDLSDICPWIKAGAFNLYYDPTQNIRGCDALNLN